MPMLVVVVHARIGGGCYLVGRIGTALFVQVLSMFAMHVTGLEILFHMLRRTLLVVLLVIVASAIVATLRVFVSTVTSTMIAVIALCMQPVAPALASKMVQLALVLLYQLLTQLVLCFCKNLFDLMELWAAIVLASLVNCLKVFCKSLKRLVAHLLARSCWVRCTHCS